MSTAAEHLQEAIDVGCTRDDHDHVADHRAEVLAEAADRLDRIADTVEQQVAEHYGHGIGPGSADMVRQAALTVRDMAGKDTSDGSQPPAGESTRARVLAELARLFDSRGRARLDGGIMTAADAAELIRQHAAGQPGKDTREGESTKAVPLCDVQFVDGRRCSKAAGHRTPGNDDLHTPMPDFFQPGHHYTHRDGSDFKCVAVTTHPLTGEPRALGWIVRNGWHDVGALDPDDWVHGYDGYEPPAGEAGAQ